MTSTHISIDDSDQDVSLPPTPLKSPFLSDTIKSIIPIDRFGFYRFPPIVGSAADDLHPSLRTSIKETKLENQRLRKWLAMLYPPKTWARWYPIGSDGFPNLSNRFKDRVRKGIPDAVRGVVWQRLAGAALLGAESRGLYAELLTREPSPADLMCIAVDLPRTYPQHVQFQMPKGGENVITSTVGLLADANLSPGQRSLRNVLWAYSVADPEVGCMFYVLLQLIRLLWQILLFVFLFYI
jgi:hypothetical protein